MASTYLTRTPSSEGNKKKWTWSAWIKRSKLGSEEFVFYSRASADNDTRFYFESDAFKFQNTVSNVTNVRLFTNRVFRDTSAWYHIVISYDSTVSTPDTNSIQMFVNGVKETSFSATIYPSQNQDTFVNDDALHTIGRRSDTASNYFDGQMAHVHLIDGTAYDASAFGETDATTGIWKPKTAPSVTYGTNGFFLKFENSGAFGTDSSGNANNFTVNGTMTQTIDTPSNVFATLNALTSGAGSLLTQGNLTGTQASAAHSSLVGTLGVSTGKYYFEAKLNTVGSVANATAIGIARIDSNAFKSSSHNAGELNDYVYTAGAEQQINNTSSSYGNTYTTGDIIGVAFDLDNNYLYFHKNGTYQNSGDPTSGATGTGGIAITSGDYFTALAGLYGGTVWNLNFGNGYFGTTAVSSAQNPDDGIGIFEYDVPTGYRALCTKSINAEEYS